MIFAKYLIEETIYLKSVLKIDTIPYDMKVVVLKQVNKYTLYNFKLV